MGAIELIILTAIIIIAVALFLMQVIRRFNYLKFCEPENRFDNKGKRFAGLFPLIFGHKKLFILLISGLMHFIIFWGFLLIGLKKIEHFLYGYTGYNFEFLGIFYTIFRAVIDVAAFLVLIVIIIGLIRWLIITPKRLQVRITQKLEGSFILFLIGFLIITMFLIDAAKWRINEIEHSGTSQISDVKSQETKKLSKLNTEIEIKAYEYKLARTLPFTSIAYETVKDYDAETLTTLKSFCWWAHTVAFLLFLVLIPMSKHFHLVTIWFNVYFRNLRNLGTLRQLDLEDEDVEHFGASQGQHFSWKQILDTYTCTHCGRCTIVCPANRTGKPLNPKEIHEKLRKHIENHGKELYKQFKQAYAEAKKQPENKDKKFSEIQKTLKVEYTDNPVLSETYTEDEIWACTTCSACEYECPVNNEHISKIVDVRRYLVLEENKFPELLKGMFKNIDNNYSPWAVNYQDRAKWAEGLNVKTVANNPDFEILWWVGCAPSIDPRAQKTAVAFAKILEKTGVNYAILGNKEKCCGDPVRKTGSEDRFQMLAQENIETLNNALSDKKERRILTMCPHGLNTLKNDYAEFGGKFNVISHVEFLLELINQGKLTVKNPQTKKIAYHDSCYLGRYNNIYEAPRKVLEFACGNVKPLELEDNHNKSLCCGAGGGWNWMEETIGKRMNVERTEQVLSTGAEVIASACPFCLTMFEDATKVMNKDEILERSEIVELLLAAISD